MNVLHFALSRWWLCHMQTALRVTNCTGSHSRPMSVWSKKLMMGRGLWMVRENGPLLVVIVCSKSCTQFLMGSLWASGYPLYLRLISLTTRLWLPCSCPCCYHWCIRTLVTTVPFHPVATTCHTHWCIHTLSPLFHSTLLPLHATCTCIQWAPSQMCTLWASWRATWEPSQNTLPRHCSLGLCTPFSLPLTLTQTIIRQLLDKSGKEFILHWCSPF